MTKSDTSFKLLNMECGLSVRRASPAEYPTAGKIKCPDCGLFLIPYSCGHALVHKCVKCHGLWFSEKKIAAFREGLGKFSLAELEISVSSEVNYAFVISTCPRCRQVLDDSIYEYNTKVHVYKCQRCRGLWLPLRQMINLMEAVKTGQAIARDVRGMLYEMGLMEREMRLFEALRSLSRVLCTPLR